jgi:23S rRNA pseudouridine2605 synthase
MNQANTPATPPQTQDEGVDSDLGHLSQLGVRPEDAQLQAADVELDSPIRFEDVVSGEFDESLQSSASGHEIPNKRVLPPQAESPKLHKVLAQAGLGSRLEMERLIVQGRILVNNEPAHVGQRIQYGDQVRVNGKAIHVRISAPAARVIAYHKPAGEVVTHDDPQNRPTVFRKLPRLHQGKWQSVGRLDLNTEGLLLLTSSGELANQLMHPRFGLEREYAVRVLGALSNEEKAKLLEGVNLDDGPAHFSTLENGGGEGSNCWYRVTISEGRNREVRRMFEAVGHAVSRLIRIRYGMMVLPRGLKRGAFMELEERDIRDLMQAAGMHDAYQGAAVGAAKAPRVNRARPGQKGAGPRPSTPRIAQPATPPGRGPARARPLVGKRAPTPHAEPAPQGFIGAESFTRQKEDKAAAPKRPLRGNIKRGNR